MRTKKYLIRDTLFVILIIAAFLRIYMLSSVPPHLTPDEAALGYNAYSILKTAKDEYGNFLPIIFKSFGDYKPGLYVYLTVPFVAVFGLNEFAVRLPSALAGIIAVWLIYKLAKHLFPEKNFSLFTFNFSIGEVAALLLAISPWHIQFSRGAWEVNVSLTLTLAGTYFLLRSFEKSKYLLISSTFFALTLITYQGAKLSTLLVLAILVAVYWKQTMNFLSKSKVFFVSALILGLIITSPAILSFFRGETGRLGVYSVFSYPRKSEDVNRLLIQGNENIGSVSYMLFHSGTANFARVILGKWFNHFSGRFLFFEGDWQNSRHSTPNNGMLLLVDMLLVVAGLVKLIRLKGKARWFILLWLILASLPAILSRDQVHAVRAYNMVIPLTLLSSLGIICILDWVKSLGRPLLLSTGYFLLAGAFLGSLVYYFDSYYIHLPKHTSQLWSYGYKQIVETVTPIQDSYERIKVQQSFAQPYIYFLFYQKYDPAKYQEQAKLVESEYKGDVGYIERIDNVYFWPINWPVDRKEHNTLVVADAIRIPEEDFSQEENLNLISEIKYLDGNTAFKVVEVR